MQRLFSCCGQKEKRLKMKLGVIALLFLLLSCKKDKSCEPCNTETGFVNAKIIYSGPPEADGCDWLVIIGDQNFRADQLPDSFKQNELEVKICYESTTEKYLCGLAPLNIPVIHIISIRK